MEDDTYQYTKSFLTIMDEQGTLDIVFVRSVQRWTQSTSFIDAPIWRALNSRRFTRSEANFVKSHTEKLPISGAYQQKPKLNHYQNLAARCHNLRSRRRLVSRKHTRYIAGLAVTSKHPWQTTLEKVK